MAARIPVKAIYSGADVTSLGEFTSSDTIAGSYLTDGSVTAAKLAADTATQAELDAVAAAALPLAGGTMTGNLVMGTNLVDGIDISARDAVLTSTTTTAGAALPKAGGTMTGDIIFADGEGISLGAGVDLTLLSDGSTVKFQGDDMRFRSKDGTETYFDLAKNAGINLRYDNSTKIATTSTGVTVTGTAVATTDTSNATGSVQLNLAAAQNLVLTLTGNVTLTNPSTEQVGQSGFIAFIQDGTGSRTVSLGTDWETAGAAGLSLTATAGATDLVPYLVVAANRILLGAPQLAFA